ncbi:YtxH domain-containing protein [Clostridium haemolyticum]|nr:YtxH domain-containing protein [Clostridium haemolyticum]
MHRFLKGLTTGAIIGATAGIMMLPQMDKRTRKKTYEK